MRAIVKLSCILAVSAGLASAFAQAPASQTAGGATLSVPPVITESECMGSSCSSETGVNGIWKFSGVLGNADWNNGAQARIIVTHLDENNIELQRIDLPNSSSYGLTAVYTGMLAGDRVEGTVVWAWSGHWNDEHPSGHWSAVVQKAASPPLPKPVEIPHSLVECEADQCAPGRQGGCRWTFHGMEGESHCRNGASSKLEVEKFDSDGIVIRRTELPDSVSVGLTALYTGTLRGNRILGLGTWSWPGHWNNHKPAGRWSATVSDDESHALPAIPGPLVSPEVHADGSVTFRALAPASLEVFVQLEGQKPVIMQKDDVGVWSLTTKPLEPDYYGYIFQDTGVPVIDPSNSLILPNLLQTENMVQVPGPTSLPWELEDQPHGEVHRHIFKSQVIGDERDFYVYTPPGYDPHSATRYPVLYLLHGYGQISKSWTEVGFANRVLDHVIDEGKAKPMIVVMPTGYGGTDILGPNAYWNDPLRKHNFDLFAKSLMNEVIPQVEHAYNVESGRDARALAGLSMGGAQSILIGLNNLDEFGWIGSFSSGGLRENFSGQLPGVDSKINSRLHLLWVACGVDDGLLGINRDFNKWLASQDIKHAEVETPGSHTWMVWRRNLAAFAPLLFQSK